MPDDLPQQLRAWDGSKLPAVQAVGMRPGDENHLTGCSMLNHDHLPIYRVDKYDRVTG
jgi:hypothetical protein